MYDNKYKQEFTEEELKSEIWKDIPKYEGLYEVSNLGRVKNNKGLVRKPRLYKDGYFDIKLSKNGKNKTKRINRLVALAFISNPNNYPVVNHKDENKLNNRVDNLEWCTTKYNNNYGTHNKRMAETLSKVMKGKYNKPIIMCDPKGNKLKEFKSLLDASNYLNKPNSSTISNCLNGRCKTAYGYVWKYK